MNILTVQYNHGRLSLVAYNTLVVIIIVIVMGLHNYETSHIHMNASNAFSLDHIYMQRGRER